MTLPEGGSVERICIILLLVAMSACAYPISSPPPSASPPPVPRSEQEVASAFLARAFSGDFRGASEFVLLPADASPGDFWAQRFDQFQNFTRRQLSWLTSCTVGGSERDVQGLAELLQRGDSRAQEVKRVELRCTPRPGLAAPVAAMRLVRINDTWRINSLALVPGLAFLGSPGSSLLLNVSKVTAQSFNLSVRLRGNFTVNVTDFDIDVDGGAIGDLERFNSRNFSRGREVRIDLGPGTFNRGSHLRFKHLPSNTTAEYLVVPE